jgi:hypothetical protein
MSAVLLTAPAAEPLSLTEAKAFLRVEHDDDDAIIASLVASARNHVEALTRCGLITQTWRLALDRWPDNGRVAPKLGPLRALVAARVVDVATNFQTKDAQLFSGIPQNSKSAAYTTVLSDAQKHIFHPSADTTARTWTIDSNANVAYPIGTAITFINQNAGGTITIAITSDTMRLAGAGTTGNRTLAANGVATAIKVTATEWIISGAGLT